jgi:hypothetical protein
MYRYRRKTMAQAANTTSVASLWNSKFHNKTGHFISIDQRYNETIAKLPARTQKNIKSALLAMAKDFKKRFPNWKKFSDIKLVGSTPVRLMSTFIDTTMQREPDINWVLNILKNFKHYQVQPIQLDAIDGNRWGAWDSQHTAIALWIIATQIFGEDANAIMVPSNIYPVSSRADIRNMFISMNTVYGKNKNAGKKSLELIDLFEQMVYGVEVDGVDDPDWKDAHTKWKHIRDAGLFVTSEKFYNTEETGAISRLDEIMSFSPEVIRQFCVYAKFVIGPELLGQESVSGTNKRPINTKEIPIITNFLALCEQNQITYTDEQIESMAQHCLDLFNADFDSSSIFWDNVHQANMNAYHLVNKGLPKTSWPEPPKNLKNIPQGLSFFYHQLRHTWATQQGPDFKFPKQPYSVYIPDPKDLF